MSWIEPVDTTRHALRTARFDGRTWSEPETVATGTDWFVNWADVPSIRPLPDGRIAAHYLESNGPDVLAYAVRITQTSTDGTWQPAVTPHRDDTPTEHGFVSLLPWGGDLLAVWLDGRNMTPGNGHGSGTMTLRSALLTPSGTLRHETLLDDRTCECCPTSAVRTRDGALVAYRDRSDNEVRNIHLVRFDGTSWSTPYPLHDDGWQINGCPVNGPALAASDDRVVAAWFTAPDGAPRVHAAFSEDGGRTFGPPLVVDDANPIGRVDAVLLDDGGALISWIGATNDGHALKIRHIQSNRTMGLPIALASVSGGRGTGMPRLARSDDHVYAAWVAPDTTASQVRLARAPINAIASR